MSSHHEQLLLLYENLYVCVCSYIVVISTSVYKYPRDSQLALRASIVDVLNIF